MRRSRSIGAIGSARARRGSARSLRTASIKTKAKKVTGISKRPEKKSSKRDAILAASLDEFCTRGFAAARLDDVAKRAGVAKGTIYLYFHDKEALFEEIVRTMLVPLVAHLEKVPPADLPTRDMLEIIIELFVKEIYSTQRRNVLRLVITEGPRFPALAEFYFHHVVKRGIAAMRILMERAYARGEIKNDAFVKFPQLVIAPCITAIIWSGLFDRFSPLDVKAMLRAHLDFIFDERHSK